MGGRSLRGLLGEDEGSSFLQLGPAWNSGMLSAGDRVAVALMPEGPQLATMSPDLADALEAEPEARRFFESLATFYRKGYVRWIDSAKRPETRQRRIATAVADLSAGRDQHS